MKEEKRIAKFFRYFETDEEMQIVLVDTKQTLENNRSFYLRKYSDLVLSINDLCRIWDGYVDGLNNITRETNQRFRVLGRTIFEFLNHKREADRIYADLQAEANLDWNASKLKKMYQHWSKSAVIDFNNYWTTLYPSFPVKGTGLNMSVFRGFGQMMNGYEFSSTEFQNFQQHIERYNYKLGQKLAKIVRSKI